MGERSSNVTCDRELAHGWRHVAAVRQSDTLTLYVDGKPVSRSSIADPARPDISNQSPLLIGFGPNDYFGGSLRDLRIHRGPALGQNPAPVLKS